MCECELVIDWMWRKELRSPLDLIKFSTNTSKFEVYNFNPVLMSTKSTTNPSSCAQLFFRNMIGLWMLCNRNTSAQIKHSKPKTREPFTAMMSGRKLPAQLYLSLSEEWCETTIQNEFLFWAISLTVRLTLWRPNVSQGISSSYCPSTRHAEAAGAVGRAPNLVGMPTSVSPLCIFICTRQSVNVSGLCERLQCVGRK